MSLKHLFAGSSLLLAASYATAGGSVAVLGFSTSLPLVEGGLFTVGVAALVAGVRIVRSKYKR